MSDSLVFEQGPAAWCVFFKINFQNRIAVICIRKNNIRWLQKFLEASSLLQ